MARDFQPVRAPEPGPDRGADRTLDTPDTAHPDPAAVPEPVRLTALEMARQLVAPACQASAVEFIQIGLMHAFHFGRACGVRDVVMAAETPRDTPAPPAASVPAPGAVWRDQGVSNRDLFQMAAACAAVLAAVSFTVLSLPPRDLLRLLVCVLIFAVATRVIVNVVRKPAPPPAPRR